MGVSVQECVVVVCLYFEVKRLHHCLLTCLGGAGINQCVLGGGGVWSEVYFFTLHSVRGAESLSRQPGEAVR